MKFLIDAQLPPKLAVHLQNKGYDAVHVLHLGLANADDQRIWEYAEKNSSSIITKDEDFAIRRGLSDKGPAIVWIRTGNIGNQKLLDWLDSHWGEVETSLARGESVVEII